MSFIDIKTYDPSNHEDWVSRLKQYLVENNIRAWNDPIELEPLILQIVAEHPKQAEAYKSGKKKLIGFFIQKIMEKTNSGANPEISLALFKKHLK